jgi:thiamine pyrophosphokinase
MKRAVILTGGEILDINSFVKHEDDFYICADIGMKNAKLLSITPHVAIGDFDSYQGDIPESALEITHPPEKDKTDTELAVEYALEHNFGEIEIWGGTGGRLDHTIANIYLLLRIYESGAKGALRDGKNKAVIINENTSVAKGDEEYITVLPIFGKAEGVTLLGTKYPLINHTLSEGDIIGISNEIVCDRVDISIKSGWLLIIASKD